MSNDNQDDNVTAIRALTPQVEAQQAAVAQADVDVVKAGDRLEKAEEAVKVTEAALGAKETESTTSAWLAARKERDVGAVILETSKRAGVTAREVLGRLQMKLCAAQLPGAAEAISPQAFERRIAPALLLLGATVRNGIEDIGRTIDAGLAEQTALAEVAQNLASRINAPRVHGTVGMSQARELVLQAFRAAGPVNSPTAVYVLEWLAQSGMVRA